MGCVCEAGGPNGSLDVNLSEHNKALKIAKKKTKNSTGSCSSKLPQIENAKEYRFKSLSVRIDEKLELLRELDHQNPSISELTKS